MVRRAFSVLAILAALASVTLLSPCPNAEAAASRTRVTRVLIKKKEHSMQLLADDGHGKEEVVSSHKVAIGPGGPGPKRKEGDMTTPVGRYHITMHQPSQYKVFLRLDYPTAEDYRRFHALKERGDLPKNARIGGDIGIHGPPVSFDDEMKTDIMSRDWTAGCIAVSDEEITQVARLVRDGTVVDIEE